MRIVKHANGFYRAYPHDDVYSYFNVWTEPSVTDVHMHRAGFVSEMQRGALREEIFEEDPDGTPCWAHKIASAGKNYAAMDSYQTALKLTEVHERTNEVLVSRHPDLIHRITSVEVPTITWITDFEPVRDFSTIYVDDEVFTPAQMVPVTLDEEHMVTAIVDPVINSFRSSSSSSSTD